MAQRELSPMLRLNVDKTVRACRELESELRLAINQARAAGGSQKGKVWSFNRSNVWFAARALMTTCKKTAEGRRV